MDLPASAGGQLQDRVGEQPERHAFGDADRERHHHDRQERRNGLGRIVPLDVPQPADHHRADQNERRRDDRIERRAADRRSRRRSCGPADRRTARGERAPPSRRSPGRCVRRPPRRRRSRCRPSPWTCRAPRRPRCRWHRPAAPVARAASVPSRINPAWLPTPTSVPTESNSARKKNTKTTVTMPGANAPAMLELQERRRQRRRQAGEALVAHDAERQADGGARQNAPQQRAGHPSRHQHRGQRERRRRQQHRPAVQVAERHQRARGGDDQAGPLQADHRDQQPDAGGDGMLERGRNRRDQPLAQADARRQDEQRAGDRRRRRARRATARSCR